MQPISIQQDAIFIADSHHHSLYNNVLDDFLTSLLKSKKRQTNIGKNNENSKSTISSKGI